jgi:UPF0271 protein
MTDTGTVATVVTVDLNADLAEGDTLGAADRLVLDSVTSASLACGFHAGSPSVMRATAAACVERGVVIGAHVSYRDREGFGRRTLSTPADVLVRDILEQWSVLVAEVDAAGGSVSFIKPHGALYNQMGIDAAVADAVVEAVTRLGTPALVAQSGTVVVDAARRAGIRVVPEAFPDRGYLADGRLVPRTTDGALIEEPTDVARRALSLVRRNGIEAADGAWTVIEVETLCIHGDAANAADTARAVRTALESDGLIVGPFLPLGTEGPGRRRRP